MSYVSSANQEKSRQLYKIVITGGPCAGKTTAISRIHDELTSKGYNVILVSETATDLIMSGIAPWTVSSPDIFQKILLGFQLEKENGYTRAVELLKNDGKAVMIFDRGMMDGLAYISTRDAFEKMLAGKGFTVEEVFARYDSVFHLVTAAKGAREYYTLANNSARTETPEQAALLDDKIIEAWKNHHDYHVIGNETDFEEKINRLISEILTLIGSPYPFEIERKFLIEYPDTAYLEKIPGCRKAEITQTYLKTAEPDTEIRVRKRTENGVSSFTKTLKRKISGIKRVEQEELISKEEYIVELINADPSRAPLTKTRYCIPHGNRIAEIDTYPFWNDKAIMEIELKSENEALDIPEYIRIIKEVTDDDSYKNSSLAKGEIK